MIEREEIMELIRNEYDPRPNLGKGNYPAFEWDDGAGRIADAILADKILAERRQAMTERDTLLLAKRALEQAQDCILGEAPPDITRKAAREDTLNKIQKAIKALS